jgi:hypothetical protein
VEQLAQLRVASPRTGWALGDLGHHVRRARGAGKLRHTSSISSSSATGLSGARYFSASIAERDQVVDQPLHPPRLVVHDLEEALARQPRIVAASIRSVST